jgi:hypothetical protein
MTVARRFASLAVALALVSAVRPAAAFEHQHHLGLAPELAILSIKDKSTASVGGGGAIHYAYGLTDQWNLALEASAAIVAAHQQQDSPDTPRTRPAEVDHAVAGVDYVIDILRWVPYIQAQAGVYRLAGGTLPSALILPGAVVGLGLDYQLTRSFAVGLAGREHFLFTKLSTYPSYTTVVLRFEYMWGY